MVVVVVTRVSGDGTTSGTGPSHHMCHGAAPHCSTLTLTPPSPLHSHSRGPCVVTTLAPCHLSLPPVLLWCTHLLCHHHLLLVRVTTVCCPADAEQRTSPCPLYRPLYSHGTLLYSTHHCTEPRARATRAPCR